MAKHTSKRNTAAAVKGEFVAYTVAAGFIGCLVTLAGALLA